MPPAKGVKRSGITPDPFTFINQLRPVACEHANDHQVRTVSLGRHLHGISYEYGDFSIRFHRRDAVLTEVNYARGMWVCCVENATLC